MEELVLKIILAALLGWSWWTPFVRTDYKEQVQIQEMTEKSETAQTQEHESAYAYGARSVFSSYIVGGVDCMDNGSYDDYVKDVSDNRKIREKPESNGEEDRFPTIYFKFMGLDLTNYITNSEVERKYYYHKAFCSDEFYMEYPYDWYVGSTDACPLTFVPEWEEEASGKFIHDWAEFYDENLLGSISEAEAYVQDGGINGYLETAMGKPVTDEYQYVLRDKDSDWLLIYDLKKGEALAAEIIIWCNLGKINVRNWDVELTVYPEEDYGRILVFQEWKSCDFSSVKAVKEYMETSDFLYELLGTALEQNVEEKIISIEKEVFTTPYHDFVRADIGIHDLDHPEQLLRQAFVYIPVTEPYQANWVVVFESFPGSRQPEGVSNQQVRERIMSTFVVLPYYHRVKEGENLFMIAEQYGEDPELAYEIADYKPNHIRQPDLIYCGQEIEIPLRVIFRREHH